MRGLRFVERYSDAHTQEGACKVKHAGDTDSALDGMNHEKTDHG